MTQLENGREQKLEAECLRLSDELARLREREERLRQNFRAMERSLTWRIAVRLNAVVARVLRLRRGPTAWSTMAELLAPIDPFAQGEGGAAPAFDPLAARHAAGATHRLGLTCASEDRPLLALGATPEPPLELAVIALGCKVPSALLASGALYRVVVLGSGDALAIGAGPVLVIVGPDGDLRSVEQWRSAARVADRDCHVVCHPEIVSLPERLRQAVDAGLSERLRRSTVTGGLLAARRVLHDVAQACLVRRQRLPFSPAAYLAGNPDVAHAIARGDYRSAEDHWQTIGRLEFLRGTRSYQLRREPVTQGLREATPELAREAATEIAAWAEVPTIALLVPVFRVELRWLQAAVRSVQAQLYPHWQLILVDDASDRPELTAYLEGLDDERIVVRQLPANRGIAGATQAALELADGSHVGLLDHDDELTVDALWLVARVIVDYDPDIVYADEAKLELDGTVVEPHFKPGFSREMILAQNYISHFGVFRTDLARQVGFRAGFEGSQDHDFLLRCLQSARSIFHLTRVLYFWRKVPESTAHRFAEKSHAWDAGVRAVAEAAATLWPTTHVEKGRFPGTYRVHYGIEGQPRVAIVIPFRDHPELLDACLASVLRTAGDVVLEIVGVDNQSREPATRRAMDAWRERDPRIRFLTYDAPFNFSAINNRAAEQVEAEHLLFLNNDITAPAPGWLEGLLELSQLPDVGAVGGQLLYPDDTLQHAGVVLGIGGVAGHSHKYLPAEHPGYFCRPHLVQNVSAVTGACLMVKREAFLGVGGFVEDELAVAFNDVDLCLRLLEAGYRNVYTPACRLYHHESKSRGHEDTPEKQQRFTREASYMRRRHSIALSSGDACYNPNLTLVSEDFSLRED